MDTTLAFLKNLCAQIKDLFVGMTPGSRIIVVLLIAMFIVSLGFLIAEPPAASIRGKYVFLYNDRIFTQAEQRAVADALAKSGLSGYTWIESKLQVKKADQHKYAVAIAKERAVRDVGSATSDMVTSLSPWDPVKTMEEKARVAAQTDVARMIEQQDEIATATVLAKERVAMDDKFWTKTKIVSAAVTVIPVSNLPLSDEVISSITALVRSSFGITDLKEISITDGRTGRAYQGTDEYLVGPARTYLGAKEKYDREWKRKLEALLNYIHGVIVSVDVDLTKNSEERVVVVEHEKSIAVVKERAQQNTPLPPAMNNIISNVIPLDETDRTTGRTMVPNGREATTTVAPFTPTNIRATVQIPRGYVRTVALDRIAKNTTIPTALTDDYLATVQANIIDNIQKAVTNQISVYQQQTAIAVQEQVTTLVYDDMLVPPPLPLTAWQDVLRWLQSEFQTLTLLGLAVVGLFALWIVMRPTRHKSIGIYESPAELKDHKNEDIKNTKHIENGLQVFDRDARSLQEEVVDLVIENPEVAAAVLRQWIETMAAHPEVAHDETLAAA